MKNKNKFTAEDKHREQYAKYESRIRKDTLSNIRLKIQLDNTLMALEDMTEHYCDLINSGDCGNWDPGTDEPVMNAREVLNKYKED